MAKTTKTPNDELDKFLLRMPEGLRETVAEHAQQAGRSMNAEMVARLQEAYDAKNVLVRLRQSERRLMATIADLSASRAALIHELKAAREQGVRPDNTLYVLLDADGLPISWAEVMTHLQEIERNAAAPIDKIDATVFDAQKASSDDRIDEWLKLRNHYRALRGTRKTKPDTENE